MIEQPRGSGGDAVQGMRSGDATWDAVQKWQFSGVGSWAENGIYAYEYTCDTSQSTLPVVEYHANDVYECDYTASAPGTGPLSDAQGTYHVVTAELTVIDTSTPPVTAKSKPVTIKVYDLRTAAIALDASFVMSTSNTRAPELGSHCQPARVPRP